VSGDRRPGGIGAGPGTYALILSCRNPRSLRVGGLGRVALTPGFYVYVGSAFGPGGVRARVEHHAARSARPHWHLDYLRRALALEEVWHTHDPERRECDWADVFESHRRSSVPIPGFGASDCGCASHLWTFSARPSPAGFRRRLRKRFPSHGRVYRAAASRRLTGV
jgi:Uri superfamily endonuclease